MNATPIQRLGKKRLLHSCRNQGELYGTLYGAAACSLVLGLTLPRELSYSPERTFKRSALALAGGAEQLQPDARASLPVL